jgi:hypothetical protein
VLEPRPPIASLAIVTVKPERETSEGAGLDERARQLLDFERESWKLRMPKARAIRERFGFSPARYHQLLNRTLDLPEALVYDPMLVRRLRRIRDARRRRRAAGRFGVRG